MSESTPTVEQLQAELARLRREQQEFTAVVSHDLRAPLRHIVSFAALVQEDAGPQLSPQVQGFLGTITESAQQLQRMLDGLLMLSRLGTQALQIGPVDLQALVADCQSALAADAPLAQWQVASDWPQVQTDAQLLGRALREVLSNALKFSAQRTPACIGVQAAFDGPGWLVLTVQDNGVGFQQAQQGQLFQPFCRLHSARSFAGLGMGLAYAHKCLERLGGSLHVNAQPDAGCTVRLRLPV